MKSQKSKNIIKGLLDKADVKINGNRPWDIQVHNENLYNRVLSQGSLGLGESYMDGWWDAENLDEFFFKILRADLANELRMSPTLIWSGMKYLISSISKARIFRSGGVHYNIGNDLYKAMLDKRLTYTCGYWKDADNLDDAQEAKLDLVCKKIGLQENDTVLDIGSGWGSFINFAAEKYGAKALGVTASKEQADYASKNTKGLPVRTELKDYRDIEGNFDHVVSLGMFEHIGRKNYKNYMEKAHSVLDDDGFFLLHTIGKSVSGITGDPWFSKYIFPDAMLPSYKQISKAAEGLFVLEDWHSFGQYYDITLMHWWSNFDNAWDSLKEKYGDKFYRMWKYYLLSSAGSFRARKIQLWQIVFSKKGAVGGYKSIR